MGVPTAIRTLKAERCPRCLQLRRIRPRCTQRPREKVSPPSRSTQLSPAEANVPISALRRVGELFRARGAFRLRSGLEVGALRSPSMIPRPESESSRSGRLVGHSRSSKTPCRRRHQRPGNRFRRVRPVCHSANQQEPDLRPVSTLRSSASAEADGCRCSHRRRSQRRHKIQAEDNRQRLRVTFGESTFDRFAGDGATATVQIPAASV